MRKTSTLPPRETGPDYKKESNFIVSLPFTAEDAFSTSIAISARRVPTLLALSMLFVVTFAVYSLVTNLQLFDAFAEMQNNEIKKKSSQVPEFFLAYNESFGFFDDIPNASWKLMQERVKERVNHMVPNDPMYNAHLPAAWYQQNFEPDFGCQHERRVGGMGKYKHDNFVQIERLSCSVHILQFCFVGLFLSSVLQVMEASGFVILIDSSRRQKKDKKRPERNVLFTA